MARFLRKNMQDPGRSTGPTGGQISCFGSAKRVSRPNQRISPSPPQSISRHARTLYIREDWWFLQSLSVDKLCRPPRYINFQCCQLFANRLQWGVATDIRQLVSTMLRKKRTDKRSSRLRTKIVQANRLRCIDTRRQIHPKSGSAQWPKAIFRRTQNMFLQ